MKTLRFLLWLFLPVAIACAEPLSWTNLAGRRELWPAQCTVNRAIKFKQGGGVEAGQKLRVLEIQPTRAIVSTPDGRIRFAVKPEDTDILQLVGGSLGALTPQERGLTTAALLQRQELWPYRVTLTEPVDLGGGHSLRPGEKVILMGVEQGQLLVGSEKLNTSFDVDPGQTDLMTQARRFVASQGGAPSRMLEELSGKLVDPLTGAPASLAGEAAVRYLVFYRGAGWCGPCREFSPSLVKLYNELKPGHPEFEILFLSDDKSPGEMRAYAKEVGFSWRAVPSNHYPELHLINPMFGTTIPQLVVTDRSGKVLIDSDRVTRPVALQKLAMLLKAGSAPN